MPPDLTQGMLGTVARRTVRAQRPVGCQANCPAVAAPHRPGYQPESRSVSRPATGRDALEPARSTTIDVSLGYGTGIELGSKLGLRERQDEIRIAMSSSGGYSQQKCTCLQY